MNLKTAMQKIIVPGYRSLRKMIHQVEKITRKSIILKKTNSITITSKNGSIRKISHFEKQVTSKSIILKYATDVTKSWILITFKMGHLDRITSTNESLRKIAHFEKQVIFENGPLQQVYLEKLVTKKNESLRKIRHFGRISSKMGHFGK